MFNINSIQEKSLESKKCKKLVFMSWILAFLMMLLGSLDVLSTNIAISNGHIEANPVIRLLQLIFGIYWTIPKLFIHFLFSLFILCLPTALMIKLGFFVILGYSAIFINNFIISGLVI